MENWYYVTFVAAIHGFQELLVEESLIAEGRGGLNC